MFVKQLFVSVVMLGGFIVCFDESDAVLVEDYTDYASCDSCLQVTDGLFSAMSKSSIQNQIVSMIQQKTCDTFDHIMKKDCIQKAQQFVPYLLSILGEISASEQVCQVLKFCPEYPFNTDKLDLIKSVLKTQMAEIGLLPQSSCSLCTLAQGEFLQEGMLLHEGMGNDVKYSLRSGCDSLPLKQSMECNHFLTQYVDSAIQFSQDFMQSKQLCQQLSFCPQPPTIASH